MAYTPVTFVYGEVLTAAKMNMLAANDASFHDGSGLPTGTPIITMTTIDPGEGAPLEAGHFIAVYEE